MSFLNTVASRLRNILVYGAYVPVDYYVLDDKRLVYVSIPKVACTSIKIAMMSEYQDETSRQQYMNIHSEAERHHTFSLRGKQKHYYTFAFVRSPFERLISCYEDKVKSPVQHNGRYFFDSGYNEKLIQSLFKSKFDPQMSFADFLDLVAKIPDFLSDGHFRSQYSMLYRRGRLIADYVGKFEHLEQDWDPVSRRFGYPALAQKNCSSRSNTLAYFATPQLVDLAASRYRRDIRAFGYQTQYETLRREAAALDSGH